ncbi:MAG: LysR family transcriptional regulator [Oscillospiraceae bacterium]
MRLDHLYYFNTICKYDNLTRAAEKINISQPALSNSVRQLETEFGVQLFHRTSKGLVLTEAGQVFLNESTIILDQINYLKKKMNELVAQKSTVNVAVSPLISTIIFPQVFHEFRLKYPNITVNLHEAGSQTNLEEIIKGNAELDLAIISSDRKDTNDESLPYNRIRLCHIPIVCYVSTAHPFAKQPYIDFSMVEGKPIAMLPDDTFVSGYLKKKFKEYKINPNVVMSTSQLSMIQRLVIDNTAVSFLYKGNFATSSSIVAVPFKEPIEIGIDLIWNKKQKLLNSPIKFLEFIKSYPLE